MIDPGMEGLRTDQAPPLSIPASFFLLAPLSMLAAGALLAWHGPALLASRWLPAAMAATHLGTLGFLGAIMLGALYQMIPVVAGAPVPAVRVAHAVHLAFALGVAALAAGLATGAPMFLHAAPALLGAALLGFLAPVALALLRAPTRSETVTGMRLALAGLAALAVLGVLLALSRAGHDVPRGDPLGMLAAHAALGGVVWIGGLITAVSWQVVPMFYLTPPIPRWSRRATLIAVALALLGVPAATIAGQGPGVIALLAAPAALLVWVVHPALVITAIRRRKRRRVDGSVRFFWAGLLLAPLLVPLSAGALLGASPAWPVALGWVAVWGWAGLVAHGMLSRIVPFLVWFHRFSALVGKVPVPTMRQLLPDGRIRAALWVHGAAVVTGLVAILSGEARLARLSGALLMGAAAVLLANLAHALRQRPPA